MRYVRSEKFWKQWLDIISTSDVIYQQADFFPMPYWSQRLSADLRPKLSMSLDKKDFVNTGKSPVMWVNFTYYKIMVWIKS